MESRLRRWVESLCAPACAGRAVGSKEAEAARQRIERTFVELGLEPGAPNGTFRQDTGRLGVVNLLARAPGPARPRAILLSAHYDHLGHDGHGEAFWGADDNAAAIAILFAVAAELDGLTLGHEIWFAAFDAEEPPYFMTEAMGAQQFVDRATPPFERLDFVVSMDLVGHALGNASTAESLRQTLFVLGAELCPALEQSVRDAAGETPGLPIRHVDAALVPPLSDYVAFQRAGVPFLFLTCGRWSHYHQVSDTPEKLDYRKMTRTADFIRALCRASNGRKHRFERTRRNHRTSIETLSEMLALLGDAELEARAARFIGPMLERLGRGDALGAVELGALRILIYELEDRLAD